MALNTLLDPVLGWILNVPLWLGIIILSFVITMIINVVYKYTTDQEEMKRLKKKLKELQAEMKKHRNDPKRAMKLQQESMSINMKYMKNSFKSTLYTIIPIIIIFSWMNAHLAYAILEPNQPVDVIAKLSEPDRVTLESDVTIEGEATKETVERQAKWTVSGPAGVHTLVFKTEEGAAVTHDLYVGEPPSTPVKKHEDPAFETTTIKYGKTTPFGNFSILGYKPGWLFTYLIFSIFFSITSRRIMKLA